MVLSFSYTCTVHRLFDGRLIQGNNGIGVAHYVAYSFISLALITERRVVQGRNDKLYLSSFLLVQVHTILRMPTIYLLLAKIMLLLLAPPFLFATLATCFFGSLSHRYVSEDFPTKLSKRGRIKLIPLIWYIFQSQWDFASLCAKMPHSQKTSLYAKNFGIILSMQITWALTFLECVLYHLI